MIMFTVGSNAKRHNVECASACMTKTCTMKTMQILSDHVDGKVDDNAKRDNVQRDIMLNVQARAMFIQGEQQTPNALPHYFKMKNTWTVKLAIMQKDTMISL